MKQNVVEWFDRTAAEMPEAPALSCSGQDVTFGRLQQQANVWANRLLAGGLQTAEAVGIFTPNRTLAIPAMLAVLKAGGAFVPLDTTLPVRRLQALLEHVRKGRHKVKVKNRRILRGSTCDPATYASRRQGRLCTSEQSVVICENALKARSSESLLASRAAAYPRSTLSFAGRVTIPSGSPGSHASRLSFDRLCKSMLY
jgi:acyl-coenzyme A synthetase/AMP-(fatty) acid ligase